MKPESLSIVIPAYNEEEAVADLLSRCLAARESLLREAGFSEVEVILVDDGSRDRTRRIAEGFPEVRLIVHPRNRGYGAALRTGFEAARGEYLGFLDGDGTCDPLAFGTLYRALKEQGAMLAIGNRLHPGSRMPGLRALGNRFFALVVSRLTGVPVRDAASGMRLFKRGLLKRLSPLPAGLHFTPAMTARAACLGIRIAEAQVPYAERRGRSKLNALADGLRFLRVILGIVFAYHPFRVFGPLGLIFGLAAFGYSLGPVSYYLRHRHLEEWMIYRLLTILTLAVCGLICLSFGYIAQRASDLATRRQRGLGESPGLEALSLGLGLLLALGGILLNSRTILEYVSSGRITIHWVYLLTGGLAVISGTVLLCFAATLAIVAHLPLALGVQREAAGSQEGRDARAQERP